MRGLLIFFSLYRQMQIVIQLSMFFFDRASQYRLFQITNLIHNSFILQQYVADCRLQTAVRSQPAYFTAVYRE